MNYWTIFFLVGSSFLLLLGDGGFKPLKTSSDAPVGKFDYAIVGGMLIDGSAHPAIRADVLIQGNKIHHIGIIDTNVIEAQLIDASGKIVSPGFIDAHAHGDPLTDRFDNFMRMGVTTLLLGQDGFSPVNGSAFPNARAYLDSLSFRSSLLNLAFMGGHGSIRNKVKLDLKSVLTTQELKQITDVAAENLAAGCFGITTGLEYLPGSLASLAELIALAKIVGEYDGLIMSHLRSEDDSLFNRSLEELLALAPYCKTHVSHLKVVYGTDKSRAFNIIDRLNRARSDGLIITADVYPYLASYTGIGIVFPDWAKTKRTFDLAKIHRKEELEAFLYQKIMSRNGPEATLFATRPFIGKTLAEASQETGKSFVDILMALGPEGASGAYFVMNENIQEAFICNPDIAIGSDGGPNLRHPRSYGTFAKMIRKYVMEETKLTLEQAVHKMTGLPASIINLPNRGLIKEGYYADILVFDPHRVEDKATFSNPYEPSSGFDWVFINGKIVLHKTEVFCPDCGKVLRCNSEGP